MKPAASTTPRASSPGSASRDRGRLLVSSWDFISRMKPGLLPLLNGPPPGAEPLQMPAHLPQSTGVARQRWALRQGVREARRATSESSRTVAFWASLGVVGAFLYWRLFAMFAQLPASKKQGSAGLEIYHHAGEALLQGKFPYLDFPIEYPPGSLLAFVPPALFTSNRVDYTTLFVKAMALAAVAALILT